MSSPTASHPSSQSHTPTRPPKEAIPTLTPSPTPPPPLPPKRAWAEFEAPRKPPPIPSKVVERPPSASSTDPRPTSYTFKPSSFLENGQPLRTVFLPPGLRRTFLDLAAANTARNLETCGILAGTLISNALFVSRVIVPPQTATSDTCETTDEALLFAYCDSADLLVLGWIHTHPTQTCFLSSRDLHTHCGYQVMLPESIAIVCAPAHQPAWGVFRLTDPPGVQVLLDCKKDGLFHLHDEGAGSLYRDALRPGHVFELEGLDFELVDLRGQTSEHA